MRSQRVYSTNSTRAIWQLARSRALVRSRHYPMPASSPGTKTGAELETACISVTDRLALERFTHVLHSRQHKQGQPSAVAVFNRARSPLQQHFPRQTAATVLTTSTHGPCKFLDLEQPEAKSAIPDFRSCWQIFSWLSVGGIVTPFGH